MANRLGDYEVLRTLEAGGMGEVLLARRRGPSGFERLCAIKTIRAELAGAATVRAMFLDEARLLARLVHPGVAQVFDFGEVSGALYLVMEYVPGLRFRELIERRPPPEIAARAVADAARAVHAAHELHDLDGRALGVVHRDLSPENLMLGWNGQVKVLDFGIALVKGRQAPVTEVGTVKGKPPYMSPEQVKNEPVDRRSDVFSLGLVLHEMLTGEPVFEGESLYAVARSVVVQELVAPSAAGAAALPDGLDRAVMRALARDLDRRTPTAGALADELERIAGRTGGETLASWAERELAAEREIHRRWLAEVVAGPGGPGTIGRPSGVLTALSAAQAAALDAAAPMAPAGQAARAPAPGAVVEPDDDDTRRSGAMLFVHVLLFAAAIFAIIGIVAAVRHRGATAPDAQLAAVTPDAALVAVPPADAAPAPADAGPAPADAGPAPADARRGHLPAVHHPDARPAAIPHPRPDARPTPDARPAGAGTVSFTADPYAIIRIDGTDAGTTPRFDVQLPAGRHHVQLVTPDTGRVRYDRVVEVRAGGHLDVQP
jgi:eukaryotic-like serine/threonine-protein kinase